MTVTVSAAPETSPPNKFGGDRTAFDAAMQAHLDWQSASLVTQLNAQNVENNAINANVMANANAVQLDRALVVAAKAAVDAQSPVANAAAAAASALAAAASATLAQATNPDAPIRLNPRAITATTVIASAYNAQSTGPLRIADGISVTVQDNATWAIC